MSAMPKVVAFDRPGGEKIEHARKALPINLAHLDRQTMGDRALEQEILGLFSQQTGLVQLQMTAASLDERMKLAHGLKGAAMAIGAFPVAECATAIMDNPADAENLKRLAKNIDDVRAFIARFTR